MALLLRSLGGSLPNMLRHRRFLSISDFNVRVFITRE